MSNLIILTSVIANACPNLGMSPIKLIAHDTFEYEYGNRSGSLGLGCLAQLMADGSINSMTPEDTPGTRWVLPSLQSFATELLIWLPDPDGEREVMGGKWVCEKATEAFVDDVWTCTEVDTEWVARMLPR